VLPSDGVIIIMAFARYFIFLLFIFSDVYAQSKDELYEYSLGSGDLINIYVYGEEDLTFDVRLGTEGVISYPFLGEILVSGKTVRELEKIISGGLNGDYLKHPRVNVSVIEYRKFFIDGEVNNPGGYPFEPGLTVQKAVAIAGGFTERASKSKIFLKQEHGRNNKVLLNHSLKPDDIITVEQSFF